MKTKYEITAKAQASRLNFIIQRKVLDNKYYGKELHASLNLLTLHPDILKIFGTFSSLCLYVSSYPENVYYDQLQYSLVIQCEVINKKCIYVPIAELEEEKTRKKIESLLILEEAVANFKKQMFIESFCQSFESKIKQVQWYTKNIKSAKVQCEEVQAQIKKIDQKLAKLYKKSQNLNDKSQNQLQSLPRQQKIYKKQSQENIQKRISILLEQYNSCEDPRVKQLKQKPIEDVNVIELNNLNLKSMIMVVLYKNLKTIRLPNNRIKRIQGLQELYELNHLDLNTNKIQVIRDLKELILHTNSISKIKNIFHLKKLEILSLSFNKLSEIPHKIRDLQSLIELRIENNQINTLPEDLLDMKQLKVITLLGNPCFTSTHKMQKLIDTLVVKKNICTMSPNF